MTALWSTVGLTHIGLPTAQPIRLFFLSFFLFLSLFSIASPFHSLCTPFSFSLIIYYFYHWISGLCKLRHIFFPPEEGRIKGGGGESCNSYAEPWKPPEILELAQKAEPRRAVRAARVWGGPWGPREGWKGRPNGHCHSLFPICPLIVHKPRPVLSQGTVPASRCH